MTSYNPDTVRESLKERLCAVDVGPYKIEYINDAGPHYSVSSEHIALLERNGVVDTLELDSAYFDSLVESYGADGFAEQY